MTICVYGASSSLIDKAFLESTYNLGKAMALRGNGLVYGAGANGVMGSVARGVKENGGHVLGVAPTFFNVDGVLYDGCDTIIPTETMRERKKIMEDKADAFIIAPGGVGTMDEFFEIFTLKQLGRHKKPIAIFNVNGFYDNLADMLKNFVDKKFMGSESMKLISIFDNENDLLEYIENYQQTEIDVQKMRIVKEEK